MYRSNRRIGKLATMAPSPFSVGAMMPGATSAYGKKGGMRVGRGRRMRGRGVREILKRANAFLKKHKIVSRGASAIGSFLPEKYKGIANKVGGVATALGYGRRRYRGMGLRPAGM
jgi:hypothetical protein